MSSNASKISKISKKISIISFNGLMMLVSLVALFPLIWMLSVSSMAPGEASSYPPPLLPRHPDLSNYIELFSHAGIGTYFLTGKERIFKLLLAALVIPGQVAMLPLFLILKNMGLLNTYFGVLIPTMASIFSIFLVRQYAISIPTTLIEAARIDGANEFRIFFSIVLPGLTPILVTLAIFTFLGTWNDFMWPLIVLSDQHLYTLPLALAALSREHVQDNEMMMAGSVLTVLPVLFLFLGLQRFYMQGLMVGSVKG